MMIVLLVLVAFMQTGCGGGASGVGSTSSNDKVSVKLNSIKFAVCFTNDGGVIVNPSSRTDLFAIADVTVTNRMSKEQASGPDQLSLIDEGGAPIPKLARNASKTLPSQLVLLQAQMLAAGAQATGSVVFVVPSGTTLAKVTYRSQPLVEIDLAAMKADSPPRPAPPLKGNPAEASGIKMTLNSAESPPSISDAGYTVAPGQGNKLYVIDVTVVNVNLSSGLAVDGRNIVLVDNKQDFYVNPGSSLGLPNDQEFPATTLAVGQQAKGKLAFVAPDKAAIQTVRYKVGVVGYPLEVSIH